MPNLTCSISKLPIKKNDRVIFLPLKYYEQIFNDGVLQPVNYTPNSYLKPILFPIIGKYNGYYGLYDIEETTQTKLIEKKMNCNIEEYIDLITASIYKEQSIEVFLSVKKTPKEYLFLLKDMSGLYILEKYYNEFVLKELNDNNDFFILIKNTLTSKIVNKEKLDEKIKEILLKSEDVDEFIIDSMNYRFYREVVYADNSISFILKDVMHYESSDFFKNDIIYFSKELYLLYLLYLLFVNTNNFFYPGISNQNNIKKDTQIELETRILEIIKTKYN